MPQAEQNSITPRALDVADLNTTVNHEPRMSSRRLAEALGFAQPHKLVHLIERHEETLGRLGEVLSTVVKTGAKGGRPGRLYWLTKLQCLYLCTKSETPNATEVTIQMVEVFDAHTAGKMIEIQRPVVVKQHRRRAPIARAAEPSHFGEGSDVLLDLLMAVQGARARMLQGTDKTFDQAFAATLADLANLRDNPRSHPAGPLFDWNIARMAAMGPKHPGFRATP